MPDRPSTSLADRWHWLVGPWRTQSTQDELTLSVLRRIDHLESRMSAADNLAARLDAATNELAADLTSVRDALAAAVAGQAQAVQDAVSAELAKLDAPIARLEALGADEADPVPAPTEPSPAAPVEDAPASPPADEPTPPAA